jgi:1-acyl-sn-glycerol-3-phosphate acyltransferase
MTTSTHPVVRSDVQPDGVGGAMSRFVARRAAAATLEQRDPEFIERAVPALWPFLAAWFRPDVHGLERIPREGPVLIVGNHSGGNVAPDTLVFTLAFIRHFGIERPFFQLAHDLVAASPAHALLHRFGTVAATHRNAHRAFERGAAVLVYPGGDWEVHRPVRPRAASGQGHDRGPRPHRSARAIRPGA